MVSTVAVHSHSPRTERRRAAGFSLVELMIVCAIVVIMVTVAIIKIKPIVNNAKADTAVDYVMNQMRQAHERAADERRVYQIQFTLPGNIILLQGNTGANGVIGYNQISSIALPNDMSFQLPNPLPASSPDGFGNGANAIDFTITGGAGGGTTIYFQPDGTVDDNVGGLTNGVIYMARNNDPTSFRAVSLFGGTGRVKAWKVIPPVGGGAGKWILE